MKEKILDVIKEALEIEDNEFDLEQEFRNVANWDSLSHLALVASLDEEFEVVIEMKDLGKLRTFNDLLDYITKNMS